MRSEEIIKVVIERVKAELNKSKEVLEAELTPEQAERVGSVLTQATSAAWGAGFQTGEEKVEGRKNVRNHFQREKVMAVQKQWFLTPFLSPHPMGATVFSLSHP